MSLHAGMAQSWQPLTARDMRRWLSASLPPKRGPQQLAGARRNIAVALAMTTWPAAGRAYRRAATPQTVPLVELNRSCATAPSRQAGDQAAGSPLLDAFQNVGAFQVQVPGPLVVQSRGVFQEFELFMESPEKEKRRLLCDPEELLHVHGYQPRGSQGERFNRYRSGLVLHGRQTLPLLPEQFQAQLASWREQVWRLAERILHQLVCELHETGMMEVQPSMGLFSEGASLDMISGSHFQLKKMHPADDVPLAGSAGKETVRLPLHQDPSFLSLLIHGSSAPPGQGLEVWHEASQEFVAVPRSGCEVATILIGQLFHLLCGRGDLRFAKGAHRVVTRPEDMQRQRLGAVFFFQPKLDTLLLPLVPPTKGDDVP
ncbi:unnamed protein product, partial [Symbiodinium pilosum]